MSELQPSILVPRDDPDTLEFRIQANLSVMRQSEKLIASGTFENTETLEQEVVQRRVNIDYLLDHWPDGRPRAV